MHQAEIKLVVAVEGCGQGADRALDQLLQLVASHGGPPFVLVRRVMEGGSRAAPTRCMADASVLGGGHQQPRNRRQPLMDRVYGHAEGLQRHGAKEGARAGLSEYRQSRVGAAIEP